MANDVRPQWAINEDGSPGNTVVPTLDHVQEHLARLATERYVKILELERDKLEMSGQIAALTAENERDNHYYAGSVGVREIGLTRSQINHLIAHRLSVSKETKP